MFVYGICGEEEGEWGIYNTICDVYGVRALTNFSIYSSSIDFRHFIISSLQNAKSSDTIEIAAEEVSM